MRKQQFYQILFLVTFWVSAAVFYVTFEGAVTDFKSPTNDPGYSFMNNMIVAVLTTFLIGSAMAVTEVLFFSKIVRKKSFGKILVTKALFYLSNMFVFISLAVIIILAGSLNKSLFSNEVIAVYLDYILSVRFMITMMYWGLANIFVLFILQVSEKFGQGILLNFVMGKYHHPKEEKRIFMFMDLKSSTAIAEKLGHIKYSLLIQDCFYDLTDIVTNYNAKIYQYVGDEVVLSWDIKKGIHKENCLNTFFVYDQLLQNKGEYYREKYGLVPEFKAGLNSGSVTAAEVGEIKKELAYHGDVLNTAARIQDCCNAYKRKLLISEDLKKEFDGLSSYQFETIDEVILRGKQKTVKLYAINAR